MEKKYRTNLEKLAKKVEKKKAHPLVNAVRVATFHGKADYNAKGAEIGYFIMAGEAASTVYGIGLGLSKLL